MFDLLIVLIVVLPLVGFAVTALIGRRLDKQAHWIPVGLIVLVWAISMLVAFATLTHAEPFGEAGHGVNLFTWIPAGDFQVHASFYVDALTACLLIVVTTIGMLVHIYSIGYMSHDPGYWRFFAYLNLFMFSMLLLVMADSFLVLFVAWELVGLSSYLLIGFWKHKRTAALAAKKAFIVNRVGDVGFALGIMLIFASLHTLDIHGADGVLARIGTLDHGTILAISLLIFAGAMGKSAQFPLHVWLPDAMEGPTPVSALIHAATMVNAGVYLLCRVIFLMNTPALNIIAWIGGFTALLSAVIAIQQNDIKRLLAYSTISQLGYMVMAVGLHAPTQAMFHLSTHAFFKALLFLCAGSVIVALHHEQDIWNMGSLRKTMPVTFWTFIVGALALAGVWPLSGFFSKDAILAEALGRHNYALFILGWSVAALTAFYMMRLILVVFF